MIFVDYVFSLLPGGSIEMDSELKASSLQVKDGDKFVVRISESGRIYFMKVEEK